MPIHKELTAKFSQAICRIEAPPQASLRRQVFLHFKMLMRLKQRGFTYASLSAEMKNQGIRISPHTLKKYLEIGQRERKRQRNERQHGERQKEESPLRRQKTRSTNSYNCPMVSAVVPINFGEKGYLEIVPDAQK